MTEKELRSIINHGANYLRWFVEINVPRIPRSWATSLDKYLSNYHAPQDSFVSQLDPQSRNSVSFLSNGTVAKRKAARPRKANVALSHSGRDVQPKVYFAFLERLLIDGKSRASTCRVERRKIATTIVRQPRFESFSNADLVQWTTCLSLEMRMKGDGVTRNWPNPLTVGRIRVWNWIHAQLFLRIVYSSHLPAER